jgi:hypothetical protein
MCDYTQVEYKCGHLRYTVKSWCTKYQETHKRCPANVVAMEAIPLYVYGFYVLTANREYRLDEKCGMLF